MAYGKLKSGKLRRVFVKTPKNNVKLHLRKKIRGSVKCAITKKPLAGIKKETNRKFKNLNLSQKRVSRAFGGYMSHSALKNKILNEVVEE